MEKMTIFRLYIYHCIHYCRIMFESKLFQILLIALIVAMGLNACKYHRNFTESGESFILQLAPGLNSEYILEKHGNSPGIRMETRIKPVNKSKNDWLVTVYHTRSKDLETWEELLVKDPQVLRYLPVKNKVDPAVNDTIKGVKNIKPNF